jgi:hypothetical protein
MLWLGMLALPFVVFLSVVAYLLGSHGPVQTDLAHTWFLLSLGWVGFAIPGAYFLRSQVFFKEYGAGGVVPPGRYLMGMTTVWLAIEIGGLLGLAGCFMSGSLMPDLIPSLVAFVLFLTMWPTGSAMTEATGDVDDPAVFHHPR